MSSDHKVSFYVCRSPGRITVTHTLRNRTLAIQCAYVVPVIHSLLTVSPKPCYINLSWDRPGNTRRRRNKRCKIKHQNNTENIYYRKSLTPFVADDWIWLEEREELSDSVNENISKWHSKCKNDVRKYNYRTIWVDIEDNCWRYCIVGLRKFSDPVSENLSKGHR